VRLSEDRRADDVESEMNQPAKAQEPSMEEILASIRRIISDDDAKPAAAAPAEAAPAPPAPKPAAAKPVDIKPVDTKPVAAKPADTKPADTKPVAAKPAAAPAAPVPAPAAKNSQDDIDAMLASFDAPAATTPQADEAEDVFELTEQMAVPAASATESFQTVELQDDLEFSESPPPAPSAKEPPVLSGTTAKAVESAFNSLAATVLTNNARTLEDLVKEMLRPMLKSWLDDNLPTLVERIVKAEIERVARGR
jgi:cell pole-organizing protein PopZ